MRLMNAFRSTGLIEDQLHISGNSGFVIIVNISGICVILPLIAAGKKNDSPSFKCRNAAVFIFPRVEVVEIAALSVSDGESVRVDQVSSVSSQPWITKAISEMTEW